MIPGRQTARTGPIGSQMSENDDRVAWWDGLDAEDRAFWLDQAASSEPIACVAAWNAFKTALPDALAGLAWWHDLSPAERRYWRTLAGSIRPRDAWQAHKAVLEAFPPLSRAQSPPAR